MSSLYGRLSVAEGRRWTQPSRSSGIATATRSADAASRDPLSDAEQWGEFSPLRVTCQPQRKRARKPGAWLGDSAEYYSDRSWADRKRAVEPGRVNYREVASIDVRLAAVSEERVSHAVLRAS